MERIISRSELLATTSPCPSSPDPAAQIKHVQEFDFVHHEELPDAINDQIEVSGEDGFAFQLFAPPSGKTATSPVIAKVRLDSPDLTDAEPGLLRPDRDSRYYFTSAPGPEQQQNFEAAALSGEDVLARSTSYCPGLAYSWKVLHIPATRRQRLRLKASDALFAKLVKDSRPATKRTRLGKKARIAERQKAAAAKALREVAEAKELREREKRVRRNREKKLKKKGKAKAKKAEALNALAAEPASVADEDSEMEDDG